MHGVSPSSCIIIASSRQIQFHGGSTRDSKAVVTPFMQDGTYPPRNFATFEPSGLRLPFTVTNYLNLNLNSFVLQHWAGVRLYTSYYYLAKSYVFIKQSPLSFFILKWSLYSEVTELVCRIPLVPFSPHSNIIMSTQPMSALRYSIFYFLVIT